MAGSEIRYAKSVDGLDIAYQILGDGPVDLVFVAGFITHLDWSWELPHFAWLEQLDGIARVITFDKRGTGLSDRSLGFGSLEERSRDIAAVMDAAGSERAVLCGVSEGGPMSILFSATNPDRVAGLVLVAAFPCGTRVPDPVWQPPPAAAPSYIEFVEREWGTGKVFGQFIQHPPDPEAASATDRPLRTERIHAEDGCRDHAQQRHARRPFGTGDDLGPDLGDPRQG